MPLTATRRRLLLRSGDSSERRPGPSRGHRRPIRLRDRPDVRHSLEGRLRAPRSGDRRDGTRRRRHRRHRHQERI